jgi:Spy/CpxP family protein refolding chaperone
MNSKIILVITLLILPFSNVFADQIGSYPGPHNHNPKHLAKELGLTPDQTSQLEVIIKEEHDKFRALHEEAHARIKAVLTGDQVAKWEQLTANPKRHHHTRDVNPETPQ